MITKQMLEIVTQQEIKKAKELVRQLYKNSEGKPFEMTNGQAAIFVLIYKRKFPRIHLEAATRYGKSETISMAVLTRRATFPGKTAIVAGNKDKARIIMQYIIGHIFDNEFTRQRFVIEKTENEENIRRYRNKDRINFTIDGQLGEIFITTAAGALGFGAPDVIEDEAALVSEQDHALVMRMLGDSPTNFLCKVGNPWESEHFRKSFEDPAYKKLTIDFTQAVREGRLTPEYVDEMRKQPFFDVLYECKFPKSGLIDEKAWIPLFTRDDIQKAFVDRAEGFGIRKLGVDVAGGGRNFSVVVQRHTNVAKKVYKANEPDTMALAEYVINKKEIEKLRPADIFVDKVGVGKGIYDVFNRTIPGVYGVNAGDKPTSTIEEQRFVNLRAEMTWKAKEWLMAGGKLERDDDWFELCRLKYRTKLEGTKGKMIIISKEEMAREGIPSPDVADAFIMTFRTPDIPSVDQEVEEEEERKQSAAWDPWNPFGLEV